MPPTNSAVGYTANGESSDAPDMENAGGDVPNTSIQWGAKAFDRMEGSIKGKNNPQSQDNDCSVNQNTGKPVYTQKK